MALHKLQIQVYFRNDMVLCISIGIEDLHGFSYCSAKTLLKIRTSIEVSRKGFIILSHSYTMIYAFIKNCHEFLTKLKSLIIGQFLIFNDQRLFTSLQRTGVASISEV